MAYNRALGNLGLRWLENCIFESISVYVLEDETLADFLGVRCSEGECIGYVYYPSRVYRRLVGGPYKEIGGYLIFTNHPRDIVRFFIEKEKALVSKGDCYVTANSFISIRYKGSVEPCDGDRLKLRLYLLEACDFRPEGYIPMNRFTNAVLELLINVTKMRYFCEIGDEEGFRRLLNANAYFLEMLNKHSAYSEELSDIRNVVLNIVEGWRECR